MCRLERSRAFESGRQSPAQESVFSACQKTRAFHNRVESRRSKKPLNQPIAAVRVWGWANPDRQNFLIHSILLQQLERVVPTWVRRRRKAASLRVNRTPEPGVGDSDYDGKFPVSTLSWGRSSVG